ncbi:MAG: type II secretion system minor pseudopilin GspJ [Gammaproteobacteria bacterium]|nr:type II secretion system minor pseudopilin GspJ [Gammaproteobacteria bacterium]
MSSVDGAVTITKQPRAGLRGGRGFTLVEVLVALGLSAVVAVLAYQSLTVASDASRAMKLAAEQMNAVERTWQFIRQDLQHSINRAPLQGQQQSLPAFEAVAAAELDSFTFVGDTWFLRLTRSGWSNPLGQVRSELQGVAYQLQDGSLYRVSWPQRDYYDGILPAMQRRLLLPGVEQLRLRFLPLSAAGLDDSDWVEQWPLSSNDGTVNNTSLPRAVEVTLVADTLPESKRVFLLAGAAQ